MLTNVDKPTYYFGHGGSHMWGWQNEYRAYPTLDFAIATATNQWAMSTWGDTAIKPPHLVIDEFVEQWLQAPGRTTKPHKPWAWKCSYLLGIFMADRMMGMLSIPSPLSDELVDAMVSGTRVATDAPVWDEQGFRDGIADILAVEHTTSGIDAFMRSDHLQVHGEEIPTIWRELGGLRAMSVPAFPAPRTA
jgi:hypothetical protein